MPSMLSDLIHPASSVLAYLDGGTGSLAIQALIASAVSGAFVIRSYWSAIRTKFARIGKPTDHR